MNPSYNYLLKKYDFENGIFIHVRYGDKFRWNYDKLQTKNPRIYVLLKPSYYANALKQFETGSPIYIFSDSTFTKCVLQDTIPTATFVEEGSYESFFCLSHCKNLILSDSTFGIAAAYLNSTPGLKVVAPGYTNDGMNNLKIIKTPFHYGPHTHVIMNRSYIFENKLKIYKEIIERCAVNRI
jgi:hypothetical protein